jgi:hypothetical protein
MNKVHLGFLVVIIPWLWKDIEVEVTDIETHVKGGTKKHGKID